MTPGDLALARTNPPAYAWIYGALPREARVAHTASLLDEALVVHLDAILDAYAALFTVDALDASLQYDEHPGRIAAYVGVRGHVLQRSVKLPGDLLNVMDLDEARAQRVDAWIARTTLARSLGPSSVRVVPEILAARGTSVDARIAAVAAFTHATSSRIQLYEAAPFSERGEAPAGGIAVSVSFARPTGTVDASLWSTSTGAHDHDTVRDVERRTAAQLADRLGVPLETRT